jgi:hypothetical protein
MFSKPFSNPAESAEFATSRDEIEADYRKKLREYKRRHPSKKAGAAAAAAATSTSTATTAAGAEQLKDADSVAKIQRTQSDATDIEGQVGACWPAGVQQLRGFPAAAARQVCAWTCVNERLMGQC